MEIIIKIEHIVCGPAFIALLLGSGIFFTIYLGMPQLRFFIKSFRILLGLDKGTKKEGETSPFQALATSLGGSIGVGCIAGTGVALNIGGPSSIFWMLVTTFFGMATKYVETALSHKYRIISEDGTMAGGPMYFIKDKLKLNWLAAIMALATIGTAFCSGNMPQANSISKLLLQNFGISEYISGIAFSIFVGLIIIGGIKRIGLIAEKLIPVMTLLFLIISILVIGTHASGIIPSLKAIFLNPLSPKGVVGGFLGAKLSIIIREGVNRSLFTNEAGCGSSGMAHSSSKEDNSFYEGVASILEPFLSTALMCTLTALVILTTGTWNKKYPIKLDQSDLIILDEKLDEGPGDLNKINQYLYGKGSLELRNDDIEIIDGKISDDFTVLNRNSVVYNFIVKSNKKPYNGILKTKNGKIYNTSNNIDLYGESLVSGPLPAAIAFNSTFLGKWGSHLLNLCTILFGLTTVLAWYYYADRSLVFLGANRKILFLFKFVYPATFLLGSITSLTIIWSLGTIFYALMSIPSIIGTLFLSSEIKKITQNQG